MNEQDILTSTTSICRSILEKLYLLAELKSGNTLSIKTMTITNHTKFNSWYRWWHDEDRHKSVDAIIKIIDETKSFLETNQESKRLIITALYDAKNGIATLLETYKEDSKIQARVNTIIAEIQDIIRQHQLVSHLPGFLTGIGYTLYQKPNDKLKKDNTTDILSLD